MNKKLVVPNSEPLQFHTTTTELLSVIREEHTSCGYGGEKRTLRKAAQKKKKKRSKSHWRSSETVCSHNVKSASWKKLGWTKMVVWPIISKRFYTRDQVDFTDLQSQPNSDYKWENYHLPHPHSLSVPMSLGVGGEQGSGGWLHRRVGACVHVLYYRSV